MMKSLFLGILKLKVCNIAAFPPTLLSNKTLAILIRFFGLYQGLFAMLVFIRICKLTELGFIVSDTVSIKRYG